MTNNIINMPDPVDAEGNISFNFSEGLLLPIKEYDSGGSQVDISSVPYFFNADRGNFRVTLSSDPNDALGRRLNLTQQQLRTIRVPCLFSFTNEEGLVPISIWEGKIYERTV